MDIVNIVRGGLLVDIFFRSGEKHAHVSFADGNAAQAFMDNVQQRDISIHDRRVRLFHHRIQFEPALI